MNQDMKRFISVTLAFYGAWLIYLLFLVLKVAFK